MPDKPIKKNYIEPVIVHGPHCSGKTLNCDSLKRLLHCEHVLDALDFTSARIEGLAGRVLVLSHSPNVKDPADQRKILENVETVSIAAASVLLGQHWIEPIKDYKAPTPAIDKDYTLLMRCANQGGRAVVKEIERHIGAEIPLYSAMQITRLIGNGLEHARDFEGWACNFVKFLNETWKPEPIKPRVVCLCGSTRFIEEFQAANLRETLAGNIVLSVGCNTKPDTDLMQSGTLTDELKASLDDLHKRKIDLADEVLILNVGGYVGDSTKSEIQYARLHRKRVRWLEPDVKL